MAQKKVNIGISKDIIPTRPDALKSDCFFIETASKVLLNPQQPGKINLTIHNSSPVGRIAHLSASYDPNQMKVVIADSNIYVAPGGKSVTFVTITPEVPGCNSLITFEVE